MKKYVLMCIATTLLSCSTLKREFAKSKEESITKVEEGSQQLLTANYVKVLLNSSDVVEEVLFWPKGIVKYSSSNGFEGEVSKISLRKKDKRQILQQETHNEVVMATQNLKFKKLEKDVLQTTLKKKINFSSFGYGLASFILLVCVGYLFYKRKLVLVK